jgi:hypothetical protein
MLIISIKMSTFFKDLFKDLYSNYTEYIIVIIISFFIYLIFIENCHRLRGDKVYLKYKDLKNYINTGDLILFSSEDYIGKVIRRVTNSYYSHCGIVIKQDSKLYILECDMDTSYDFITNKINRNGVHIISLDDKINEYTGNIFGLCKVRKTFDKDHLRSLIEQHKDITFNNNLFAMYGSVIKNKDYSRYFLNDNKMFCSEFVSNIYCKLNLIKRCNSANMYTPKDISNLFKETIFFKKN